MRETTVIGSGTGAVKVYPQPKRPGKPKYILSWYLAGRRIRRLVTGADVAMSEATRISTELTAGDAELTKFRRKDIVYYQQCEAMAGGVPLHVVVEDWLRTRSGRENRSICTAKAVQEYLISLKQSGVGLRHQQTMRYRLSRFSEVFATKSVGRITTAEIEEFLRNTPWSKRTRNACLLGIRSLYRFLQRKGFVTPGPTAADNADTYRFDAKDPEIFTVEETRKLLTRIAPVNCIPFLAIRLFAGIRWAELARCQWEDIDWEREKIWLRRAQTKTRRRREVPFSDNLLAWLSPWRGATGPICFRRDMLRPVREAIVLWNKEHPDDPFVWKQNAPRHTFASNHVALGGNPVVTAAICGHRVEELESTYKELVHQEDAEKYFQIFPLCSLTAP